MSAALADSNGGGRNPATTTNEMPNRIPQTGHDQMHAIQIRRRNTSVGERNSGSCGTVIDISGSFRRYQANRYMAESMRRTARQYVSNTARSAGGAPRSSMK